MAKPKKSAPLRRSSRVQIKIPVAISGTLPNGNPFSEETYVVCVSKFGAKVKMAHRLQPGTQISVRPRTRSEGVRSRVVWIGQEGSPRAGEMGIEYLEITDLLGINFPD